MSVLAGFTVDADDFTLRYALTAAPDMIVEIERVVATMEDRVMPYFRVSGGSQSDFETAFNEDSSGTNAEKEDKIDEAVLYRAEETEIDSYRPVGTDGSYRCGCDGSERALFQRSE